MKICKRCNKNKSLSCFNKAKNSKDRLKSWCVECCSKWNKNTQTPEQTRSYNLKKKYGLSVEEYNQMFLTQEGKCKICSTHQSELKKRLYVDHCHATGKVRGLLCHNCNLAIGYFQDNSQLMLKGANYV